MTSEKRGPSCPNWGDGGGGFRGFGQCPKENVFLPLTPSLTGDDYDSNLKSIILLAHLKSRWRNTWARCVPQAAVWPARGVQACLSPSLNHARKRGGGADDVDADDDGGDFRHEEKGSSL